LTSALPDQNIGFPTKGTVPQPGTTLISQAHSASDPRLPGALHVWNGNVEPALKLVDGLKVLLGGDGISAERQKLLKAVREFGAYIATNQELRRSIPEQRDDQHGVCGIGCESAGDQTDGEAAADALDATRISPLTAGSGTSAQ